MRGLHHQRDVAGALHHMLDGGAEKIDAADGAIMPAGRLPGIRPGSLCAGRANVAAGEADRLRADRELYRLARLQRPVVASVDRAHRRLHPDGQAAAVVTRAAGAWRIGHEPDDLAFDQVRAADEARDLHAARAQVDVFRRPELGEPALEHHRDAVRHHHRLGLVVGHVERGDADPLLQLADEDPHLVAQHRVEVGQRLVEQQQPRLDDQRPGERHPLLLAAGELPRIALQHAAQLDHAQHRVDPLADLRLADAAHLQSEREVALDRQVREQRVVLEHHADVAALRRLAGDFLAIEQDPSRIRIFEAGHAAQRGGLAAAARAEQRDELAFGGGEVEVMDRRNAVEGLPEAVEYQPRHSAALTAIHRALTSSPGSSGR